MSQTELITKMDRVVCAARVMRWVRENMPGGDLGQQASALATLEMDAALQALDDAFSTWRFDSRSVLYELAKNQNVKIEGL